jgi:hypothetical protein
LIGLQLLVTSKAIGEDTWDLVSLNNLKEGLARESCDSARNSIGWDDVDPNPNSVKC